MRCIIAVLLLIMSLSVHAGDTLTRAEVYNFGVGDTFVYRLYDIQGQGGFYGTPSTVTSLQISYRAYVVTDIYFSADTLTEYIVRNQFSPAPSRFDTMVLADIMGYEVILDSINYSRIGRPSSCYIDGFPDFFGRKVNSLQSLCTCPGITNDYFASGLGNVLEYSSGGAAAMNYWFYDSTILVYYWGNLGTYGSLNITSIGEVPVGEDIKIYPVVNDGTFILEMPSQSQIPVSFSLYDLQGKKCDELSIDNLRNTIHLDGVSNGLYIYKVSDGNSSRTGKLSISR